MKSSPPLLLHCVHRLELAYFLLATLNHRLRSQKGVCFADAVAFSREGMQDSSFLAPREDKSQLKLVSKHHFAGSQQRAYLRVLERGVFRRWKKKLVVLTEVGLLLFSGLSDFQPLFFPTTLAELNWSSDLSRKLPEPPKQRGEHEESIWPLLEVRVRGVEPLELMFGSYKERSNWIAAICRAQERVLENERRLFQ